MKTKTASEVAFESFCEANGLSSERIDEGTEPTPDYRLQVGSKTVYIEVKQIDEDSNFSPAMGTRSPGSHIRAKINQARNQVRLVSQQGFPAVLLVYNNLDPLQMFGTEQHDFLAAMYGDLTVYVAKSGQSSPGIFHGRNKSFREGKNDSFSAVGWLYRSQSGVGVHLYENAHARVPLDFSAFPQSIQFNRVQVEDA
jgi:hypothetical protein